MIAEKLLADLADYMKASQEEEKARVTYEGYSWGYYGAHFIERRIEAGKAFEETLNDYIDSRITALTGAC